MKSSRFHPLWIAWVICAAVCIILVWMLVEIFAVPAILDIQLAPDGAFMFAQIKEIPTSGTDPFIMLEMNTKVDYVFVLAYSLLILFSFQILMKSFDAKLNGFVVFIAFLPGLFDVMENNFLLASCMRKQALYSGLFYRIVRIKWGLSILPTFFILIVALYGLIMAYKATKR